MTDSIGRTNTRGVRRPKLFEHGGAGSYCGECQEGFIESETTGHRFSGRMVMWVSPRGCWWEGQENNGVGGDLQLNAVGECLKAST